MMSRMHTAATLSFVLAAVVWAACAGGSAEAQNYPWCAHYDMGEDDAVNCGFVSNEQCLETVRGIGGFCMPNNDYRPPAAKSAPPVRLRRNAKKLYSHKPT